MDPVIIQHAPKTLFAIVLIVGFLVFSAFGTLLFRFNLESSKQAEATEETLIKRRKLGVGVISGLFILGVSFTIMGISEFMTHKTNMEKIEASAEVEVLNKDEFNYYSLIKGEILPVTVRTADGITVEGKLDTRFGQAVIRVPSSLDVDMVVIGTQDW